MAQTLRSKRPAAPKLDWTFVATLFVCSLLAGGFGYWRLAGGPEISEEDFAFDGFDIDVERLEREYTQTYGTVDLEEAGEEWEQLLAAGRKANEAQFSEPSKARNTEIATELKLLAHQIIPATGFSNFVVTGEPLFERCQKGLETLLQGIREGDIDLQTARQNPPGDHYGTYRRHCGKLLPRLIDRGLVDEDGTWGFEQAPLVVQILHRYRWAHVIYDDKRPRSQLTPYELEVLARWRVEMAEGLDPDSREEHLDELVERNPDYNEEYARGVLAFQRGDLDEALEHFEQLAQDEPGQHYGRYAAYLRDRLERDDSQVAEGDDEAS